MMREGQFIQQNKARWESYQHPAQEPDELARRFTSLVDDLGYAKTFYPHSNTVKYLNALGANLYLSIYKNNKEKKSRLLTFWTEELPLILFEHRRRLFFALLFFAAFVALGVFSAWQDQTFARAILGDGYVDMTEQNIAAGDPFGVYKNGNRLAMFAAIAYNNIKVSFYCFIMGILGSVGTLYFLLSNGIMLGVFEHLFFAHGLALGLKSILVVFIHGTLEISALVIAGGAGLVLGHSLLFPKTLTRAASLRQGAKDGIKIMVGLIPVFLMAAFFESYVTRHTEMPVVLSLILLGSSLAFVLFYFVYYPRKVFRDKSGLL